MLRKRIKINPALGLLLVHLAIAGCQKEDKKTVTDTKKTVNDSIKTTSIVQEDKIDYHNFNIYNISLMSSAQNNELADVFISVSDIYTDPHPIQEDILKQKGIPFEQLQCLELDSKHRKKMIDALHLTEDDSLYLFNYELNTLQKIPINQLKAVAYLSPYISEGEEIDPESYMLGFQIEANKRNDIYDQYNNVIAYFGNKNPFIEGKMQAIAWKKAGADIAKKYFTHSKLKPGNTYQARYENLTYYMQDYLEEEMVTERKLVVFNDHNEKIFEKTITTAGSDGAEFSPLNGIEADQANYTQWTGYLFKGKPPVIFGFMTQSFGCPSITFLDKKEKDFTINCDNRH
ncbi:hypothetical protein [Chryseobacterium sp.]|uniref:hypothetical protein n=1 Tax=Chryseobacterium sp. TaxID=1871047 RepID=UPI003341C599